MKLRNISGKKAVMEMSVGTIVTIVLLMTVLILGLVMVQKIFGTGKKSIDQIETALQSEITKLFADEDKKVVIYPPSRELTIKKGDYDGFGFSIKNNDPDERTFSYEVKVLEIGNRCRMSEAEANDLITLGQKGSNIKIPSGSALEDPIIVKISVPESASICEIRYGLDIKKDSQLYLPTMGIDVIIK